MAGKNKKNKSSWDYYLENDESRHKKNKYARTFNKKKRAVRMRVEANRKNREAGTYGNGDNLDYDHATNRMVAKSTNRGRKEKSRVKGYKMKQKGSYA